MAAGVFQATPPKLPKLMGLPFSQSKAWGGGKFSNSVVASTGYAHDLPLVIDCRSGGIRVAGKRRLLLHLADFRPPDDSLELTDLGGTQVGVVSSIFRPSHYLSAVIGSGGITVVASQRG